MPHHNLLQQALNNASNFPDSRVDGESPTLELLPLSQPDPLHLGQFTDRFEEADSYVSHYTSQQPQPNPSPHSWSYAPPPTHHRAMYENDGGDAASLGRLKSPVSPHHRLPRLSYPDDNQIQTWIEDTDPRISRKGRNALGRIYARHLPKVTMASQRLQEALEVHDLNPWPSPTWLTEEEERKNMVEANASIDTKYGIDPLVDDTFDKIKVLDTDQARHQPLPIGTRVAHSLAMDLSIENSMSSSAVINGVIPRQLSGAEVAAGYPITAHNLDCTERK